MDRRDVASGKMFHRQGFEQSGLLQPGEDGLDARRCLYVTPLAHMVDLMAIVDRQDDALILGNGRT